MGQIDDVAVFVSIRGHDQFVFHDFLSKFRTLGLNRRVAIHHKDVFWRFLHDEFKRSLIAMRRRINFGVHAHIGEPDLAADDGAAAVVAQHVESAAGHQSNDSGLSIGEAFQRLDARVEAFKERRNFRLLAKDGSNRGRIQARLGQRTFVRGGQIDDRRDFAQGIIGAAQASTDEDDVRLAGHDGFHVRRLDGAQVGDAFGGYNALHVLQRRGCGTDHAVFKPKGHQNIQ